MIGWHCMLLLRRIVRLSTRLELHLAPFHIMQVISDAIHLATRLNAHACHQNVASAPRPVLLRLASDERQQLLYDKSMALVLACICGLSSIQDWTHMCHCYIHKSVGSGLASLAQQLP